MYFLFNEHKNQSLYNMEAAFKLYNHLLFNDELELSFPLEWKSMKHAMGNVRFTVMVDRLRRKIPVRVISLGLTTFYDLTERQFIDTLVHEMIHVKLVQDGIYEKENEGHGKLFFSYVDKFNGMNYGFDIQRTENIEDIKVNSDKKAKPLFVVKIDGYYKLRGKLGLVIVRNYVKNEMLLYSRRYQESDVSVYSVTNRELYKYTISKNYATSKKIILLDKGEFDKLTGDEIPIEKYHVDGMGMSKRIG